jgi:hypothetical protein
VSLRVLEEVVLHQIFLFLHRPRLIAEPSQLGRSDGGMRFVFNKGTPKVSTTS